MKADKSVGAPGRTWLLSLLHGVVFSKSVSFFYPVTTALLVARLFGVGVSAAGSSPC